MEKYMSSIELITKAAIGQTKKGLAITLDAGNSLHNFNLESGPTSYKNYSRPELLAICFQFGIDPLTDYDKSRIDWVKFNEIVYGI